MCDASVKMRAGYGVFNCQCGFRLSVNYPTLRGTYHYNGTKAEWVQDRLMEVASRHMSIVKARS